MNRRSQNDMDIHSLSGAQCSGRPMKDKPFPKKPRREKEKRRQRQEVLSVALDLFSAKGYHNVSMQEIAQGAGFAVGTLYKFFVNKEDLYMALVVDLADRFDRALMTALEQPDDEVDKLRSYIRTKVALFREDASTIRLYFGVTQGGSFSLIADLAPEIRERYNRLLEKLASVFENGVQRGRFERTAEPVALAVALEGILNAFIFHWLEAPQDHPFLKDPDLVLNILLEGLLPQSS